MPKIFLDCTPQRAMLRASQQVVEQLVDVPKPVLKQDELLDAYHDAEGCLWFSLLVDVGDRPHPADPTVGCIPWMPPTGRINILVIMQLEFEQSKLYENMEMPQFQFFDRVVDIPVVCSGNASGGVYCTRACGVSCASVPSLSGCLGHVFA